MSWTKRQIIEQALEEIGLGDYAYNLTPEQLQSGLRRLDAMIAEWYSIGIILNYPLYSNPDDSIISEESNLPSWALEAVYLNLALKLAPSYGKTPMPDTRINAKYAYNRMLSNYNKPGVKKYKEDIPIGSGNKPYRYYDNEFFGPSECDISTVNKQDGKLDDYN